MGSLNLLSAEAGATRRGSISKTKKRNFVITLLDEKNDKAKKTKASVEDPKTTKMFEFLCDDMVEVEGRSSDDDDEQEVCDICDDGGTILRFIGR